MKASRLSAVFFSLMVAAYVGSNARAGNESSTQQQLDALYAQLLQRPDNLDLTLQYAQLAEEMGDYEAAISPMERLLMNNPDAPRIKLKLGILYYMLGSYDMSKTYLVQAKEHATDNPDIHHTADEYLNRM